MSDIAPAERLDLWRIDITRVREPFGGAKAPERLRIEAVFVWGQPNAERRPELKVRFVCDREDEIFDRARQEIRHLTARLAAAARGDGSSGS